MLVEAVQHRQVQQEVRHRGHGAVDAGEREAEQHRQGGEVGREHAQDAAREEASGRLAERVGRRAACAARKGLLREQEARQREEEVHAQPAGAGEGRPVDADRERLRAAGDPRVQQHHPAGRDGAQAGEGLDVLPGRLRGEGEWGRERRAAHAAGTPSPPTWTTLPPTTVQRTRPTTSMPA